MTTALSNGNPAALEARDLTLQYESEAGFVSAVEHIDFTIHAGERLVLLGPSGCGKSSILKAAAGFITPTSGKILLNGRPISGAGPDRVVVFQEFDQLLPWKTVRGNVAFPLRVARGLSRSDANARAEASLVKVGLERVFDSFPHTLSGGMKQRVAIARALAMEPDILLMDEPFAALDALTRSKLQADLLALADELKFTLLFVTHSVEEAVLVGTKVHILSAHPGRTVATFDTSIVGIGDRASQRFISLVKDITSILFPAGSEIAA